MSKIVRCKLRCMSVDNRHDRVVVTFYAVTPHSTEPENASFYKYTPALELTMEYQVGEVPDWVQAGESYYLDMVRCEQASYPIDWSNPALWILEWGIQLNGPESRAFSFTRRSYIRKDGQVVGSAPFNGRLNLTVDNPDIFDTFGLEGEIFWTFDWTPTQSDYSFYVNGEMHHVLGVPTFDDIVRLSGIEGEVVVGTAKRWDDKELKDELTRDTFSFNIDDSVCNAFVVNPK